jgi:DNA-directed RNA polymerase subunit N (RpoN/RPB10)
MVADEDGPTESSPNPENTQNNVFIGSSRREKVLNELGITRYCCRRIALTS